MIRYRVSIFANVPKMSKSSLRFCYMSSDDVVGRHWGTSGCHFMTSWVITGEQSVKRLAYDSNLIQFVFIMTQDKISKFKSVNEMVLEVSCSHLKLNILLKILMAAI